MGIKKCIERNRVESHGRNSLLDEQKADLLNKILLSYFSSQVPVRI
jgi:hypothetical protein